MPTTAATMGAASSDRPAATACAVAWGAPAGFDSTERTTSAVDGGAAGAGGWAPSRARGGGALAVQEGIVARVYALLATHAEPLEGDVEDRRIGLANPALVREHGGREAIEHALALQDGAEDFAGRA